MEISGCGCSQVKREALYPSIERYAGVPNAWDRDGCRDTTASAQQPWVRADCFLYPAHSSHCRSEAALDGEVRMVKMVSKRGRIWGEERQRE